MTYIMIFLEIRIHFLILFCKCTSLYNYKYNRKHTHTLYVINLEENNE